jgi:hypothetical protein
MWQRVVRPLHLNLLRKVARRTQHVSHFFVERARESNHRGCTPPAGLPLACPSPRRPQQPPHVSARWSMARWSLYSCPLNVTDPSKLSFAHVWNCGDTRIYVVSTHMLGVFNQERWPSLAQLLHSTWCIKYFNKKAKMSRPSQTSQHGILSACDDKVYFADIKADNYARMVPLLPITYIFNFLVSKLISSMNFEVLTPLEMWNLCLKKSQPWLFFFI